MKITSEFRGLKEVQKGFDNRMQSVKETTPKALAGVALDLLGKSVAIAPISPLGTESRGDLRGSAYARVEGITVGTGRESGQPMVFNTPTISLAEASAVVGYSSVYSLIQHEMFPVKTDPTARWKFLEAPFTENTRAYIKFMRDEYRKAVSDAG